MCSKLCAGARSLCHIRKPQTAAAGGGPIKNVACIYVPASPHLPLLRCGGRVMAKTYPRWDVVRRAFPSLGLQGLVNVGSAAIDVRPLTARHPVGPRSRPSRGANHSIRQPQRVEGTGAPVNDPNYCGNLDHCRRLGWDLKAQPSDLLGDGYLDPASQQAMATTRDPSVLVTRIAVHPHCSSAGG